MEPLTMAQQRMIASETAMALYGIG
jgi:hypothetical protein